MRFNDHSELKDQHAFLSPSSYHWLNYTPEKMQDRWIKHRQALRGTRMHEYAQQAIELGIRQAETGQTINMYINDAIGFRMRTEQPLFYSVRCFGTADAISFRDGQLRIFDLKTGENRTSMKQLLVYSAIFCLEYGVRPSEIDIELRIYQSDEVKVYRPETPDVAEVMDRIVYNDRLIERLIMEGVL